MITAPSRRIAPPKLEELVFRRPSAAYTEPVFTPQGWVIIQVVKIDKGEQAARASKT